MSSLPPKAEDGVFTASSSAVIDAPIEKVWEVLLNFPAYPEWNSFIRTQTIVDRQDKPAPAETLQEGSYIFLTAHIPPSMEPRSRPSTTRLVVIHLDPENHRVAWKNRMSPWIMTTERWQWLSVTEDQKTKYETIEVFSGWLAYVVKWLVGKDVKTGFLAMADDLKRRSEELVRGNS